MPYWCSSLSGLRFSQTRIWAPKSWKLNSKGCLCLPTQTVPAASPATGFKSSWLTRLLFSIVEAGRELTKRFSLQITSRCIRKCGEETARGAVNHYIAEEGRKQGPSAAANLWDGPPRPSAFDIHILMFSLPMLNRADFHNQQDTVETSECDFQD